MTSLCDARDYYKRMLELQGKLRKSEEERIRLEERFNLLVQESRNRHDACISRLRMRYIEFLEEQRIRDERNHKLLGTLDRVDNSLSLMAVKTEKLNVLRKQYEAYLLQSYANRQRPGSITGDSGIVSQIDEGYSKKNPSVVHFSHRVPLSTVHTKVGDNSSKVEQTLHVQNLSGTRSSPLPSTLHNKINISSRGSAYEGKPNSPRIIQNVNPRLQLSQIPSSQIYQPCQDIYSNGLMSSTSLQVNRNLQAQYLPTPSLENIALSRSLMSQYNKLSTSHMEPIQNATSFAPNGVSAAENILRRNSSNIPQSHITPTFSQHQSNIPITQHTLYHTTDVPQNTQRLNFRDIASFSALGSMPTKIVKADSPRRAPVEMSPRIQGQVDYSSTYKPSGRSFNGLKPKEVSTHFLPRNNSPYRNIPNLSNSIVEETMRVSSSIPRKKIDLDEESRATRVLENELDRCIDKIRNLHRELDVQSLEEHDYEQNTSGDLLNITLSDDGTDYPPDKAKDERVPQDVAKVLALADDLASKKPVNDPELFRDNKKNDGSAEDKSMKSETRYDVLSGQIGETSGRLEKENINNNVESFNQEIEQLDKNNSNLEKQNWNRAEVKNIQYSNESKETNAPQSAESVDARNESSDVIIEDPKERTKEDSALQKEKEVEISQEYFNVELLSPWDINCLAKEVLELRSSETAENKVQSDEYNENAIAIEDEGEKQVPEAPVVLESEPENVIMEQIDTVEEQDSNKDLEIPLNNKDFSEENKKEETIEDTSINNDNLEYTHEHYENEIGDAKVEEIQENKNIEEDNQVVDVPNISGEEFVPDEQNVQELDQNDIYASDINQEFVDPNQQYDYSQTALDENTNNEEYQTYANDDYGVTDETAVRTQDEYLEQQYEQYPVDSTQEYVQENQEYYENKDGSNVYGENYQTDQLNDNEENPEYLQEQYNTVEADQVATNIETDQNVGDNLASDEIDKEPTNPNNDIMPHEEESVPVEQTNQSKKKKDVINSLLDSDTESTIERNVSNTESDFDFQ